MKILIITNGYPTQKYPLNGIFTYDQAKALQALGHEVTLAAVDLRSIRRWRRWGKYHFKQDNINIYNYSLPIGPFPINILTYWGKKCFLSIFKTIVKHQGLPDIVHAHFYDNAYMATPIKEKYNIPFVITEHSSTLNKDVVDDSVRYYAKCAYNKADKILAVSSILSNKIKNLFGIDSIIVPNVLDLSSIKRVNKNDRQNNKNDVFTMISIGLLLKRKGFDLLINALEVLKGKKFKLLVIGEGEEKNNLQKQINSLGLQENIFLLGFKKRNEISEILEQSDAFVLASHVETFGVVYIEAMAAGLPVIATACGGPEDFVNEQNGLLIPTNDIKALKNAITTMYNTYRNYDADAISEECIKKFSPHTIATQLTEIYKSISKK